MYISKSTINKDTMMSSFDLAFQYELASHKNPGKTSVLYFMSCKRTVQIRKKVTGVNQATDQLIPHGLQLFIS